MNKRKTNRPTCPLWQSDRFVQISMVEAAGVEPASGDGATKASPRSARVLHLVMGSPTDRVSHHQPD